MPNYLYNRIKDECQEQGINLFELTKRMELSSGALYKVVRGDTSPSAEMIAKICVALGKPVGELFSTEPFPERKPVAA